MATQVDLPCEPSVERPHDLPTARGSRTGQVAALEVGADDYPCKPFSTRELIARVRAILQRE